MKLPEKINNINWFDLPNKLKSIFKDFYASTLNGVQSITGDGVGGTSTDVVMTFPTPAEIGAQEKLTAGENINITGNTINAEVINYDVDILELQTNKTDKGGYEGTAQDLKDLTGLNGIVSLKVITEKSVGDYIKTSGYYPNSKLGGAIYKKVDPTGLTPNDMDVIEAADGSFWQLQSNGAVNIYQFGALGNNTQTLLSYSRQVDNNQVTLTQQTQDGISIDGALDYLESIGGGVLYLPKGIYRTRGYQRDLTFSVSIYGDGIDQTIIKATDDAPTNTHGYGIFCSYGDIRRTVHIDKLTLDGNAHTRNEPTSEFRSYNLVIYGTNVHAIIDKIKSINSPIDCFNAKVDQVNHDIAIRVSNSHFEDSFRNTVTIGKGENIKFTNCTLKGGGTVHNGTAPWSVLDIEPNGSTNFVTDTTFVNCNFSKGISSLHSIVWSEVNFIGCYFDAGAENPNDLVIRPDRPYLGVTSISKVTYQGCTFRKNDNHRGVYNVYTDLGSGEFAANQFTKMDNCYFEGVGINNFGKRLIINNVLIENALHPVTVGGSGAQELKINNLTLINVLDTFTLGVGQCSFSIRNNTEGPVYIDGLKCLIEPDKWPTTNFDPKDGLATIKTFGVYLNPAGGSTSIWRIRNVHAGGYYKLLPAILSESESSASFRDWQTPNTAPSDTAGQTLTLGTLHYRDCTMRGNF